MTKIKLNTLTDVHVGSGEQLYEGMDFLVTNQGKNVNVIDINKMGAKIEPKYIDNWVSMVNAGKSFNEIMQRFTPNAHIRDFTKYTVENYAIIKKREALKEQLRDGRGLPYIPGSSIKGAIRTAILSTVARKKVGNINAQNYLKFEKDNLGSDPNHSLLRFLEVGDSFFKDNSVIVVRTESLNLRKSNNDLHDPHICQLLEVIAYEETSEFTMKLDTAKYSKIQERYDVNALPKCMSSVGSLFHAINEHSKKLLKDEIDFWNQINKTGSEEYIENVNKILEEASNCVDEKECVLRLGSGSGWRFTTGAWTEPYDFFYNSVVDKSRHNPQNYLDYPFPKTRIVENPDDKLLGFIKLKVVDN